MDRSSVYIETTVVSYLAARPSRHPETARRQALTHAWWTRRVRYRLVTSVITVEEASQGDPSYAVRRLGLLRGMGLLHESDESAELARALLRHGGLPERARNDARQIAIAAVYRIEHLLSWDRTHITNAALRPRLERVCRLHGCELPLPGPPNTLS